MKEFGLGIGAQASGWVIYCEGRTFLLAELEREGRCSTQRYDPEMLKKAGKGEVNREAPSQCQGRVIQGNKIVTLYSHLSVLHSLDVRLTATSTFHEYSLDIYTIPGIMSPHCQAGRTHHTTYA